VKTQTSAGSQVIKSNQKKKKNDKETDQAKSKKAGKAKTTKKEKTTTDMAISQVIQEAPKAFLKKEALFNIVLATAKGFVKATDDSKTTEELKGSVCNTKTRLCRLNIYWTRAAVGVHSRRDKSDFAYYRLPLFGLNWSVQMAVALKIAELLALRLHLRFWLFSPFVTSTHDSGMHGSSSDPAKF